MPRPEQLVPRAGAFPEEAEHGAQAELQRLAAGMLLPPDEAGEVAEAFQADQGMFPEELPEGEDPDDDQLADDINDGFDDILFGPSWRPDEPITAGMPFGEGPGFVARPQETEEDFMSRVADELDASGIGAAQQFAARLRRGER